MKNSLKQRGFSAVELLLILLVIGIIGFIGYTVFNRAQDNTETNQVQQDAINDAEDLDKAVDDLNAEDIDSLDTSELDTAESELL